MPDARLYTVTEYHGQGDPYFGGDADDRPLGRDGSFLTGCYSWDEVATFDSNAAAYDAADAAPNRRPGALIGLGWENETEEQRADRLFSDHLASVEGVV